MDILIKGTYLTFLYVWYSILLREEFQNVIKIDP
jgi:hypothetical protein